MSSEKIRLTRPVAADVRDWRDTICDALNKLNVHVGEDFEIVAVAKSSRPPIATKERTRPRSAITDEVPDEEIQHAIEQGSLI